MKAHRRITGNNYRQIKIRARKGDSPANKASLLVFKKEDIQKYMDKSPSKDMVSWVLRSMEVRMVEANRKQKIARPMNAFMLYRTAYFQPIKTYLMENHQILDGSIVSQVAGQCWASEPESVREFYKVLADVERNNHFESHPGYRYQYRHTNKQVRDCSGQSPKDGTEDEYSRFNCEWEPDCTRSEPSAELPCLADVSLGYSALLNLGDEGMSASHISNLVSREGESGCIPSGSTLSPPSALFLDIPNTSAEFQFTVPAFDGMYIDPSVL